MKFVLLCMFGVLSVQIRHMLLFITSHLYSGIKGDACPTCGTTFRPLTFRSFGLFIFRGYIETTFRNHFWMLRFTFYFGILFVSALKFMILYPPVRTPGVQVENTSSVSPACRKRRLKGRRYIAIVADTA